MHVGLLFKKLGVTNRTMAAVRGVELLSDAGSRHHGRRHRAVKARPGSGDYGMPARVRAALLDRSSKMSGMMRPASSSAASTRPARA
ncbi:hypothetical protein CNMCM8686_000408 [Aspergillus fumigatus]|nr:hypothetical protein CNMCM8686_000408 [Aspergillus fumigatus]